MDFLKARVVAQQAKPPFVTCSQHCTSEQWFKSQFSIQLPAHVSAKAANDGSGWPKSISHCHPCGRPRCSFCLPTLSWSKPGRYSHLGSESAVTWKISIFLSLCLLSQSINKNMETVERPLLGKSGSGASWSECRSALWVFLLPGPVE